MATPAYPSELPGPMTYDMVPATQLAASDFQGGPHDQRNRTRDPGAMINVSFRYLQTEYKQFIEWFKLYGHKWFTIPLPSAAGIVDHVCKFTGKPKAKHDGHRHWSVSAELEVRERIFIAPIIPNPYLISLMNFEDPVNTVLPQDEIALLNWETTPDPPFHRTAIAQGAFGSGGFYRFQDPGGQIAGGLRCLNTSALVGKIEWTADLWVRIDGNPWGISFSKKILNIGNITVEAEPKFVIWGYGSTSPNYDLNTPYWITVEYDNGTLRLYVNGSVVSTLPSFTFTGFSSPIVIGVGCNPNGNGDYYVGAVDMWRLTAQARHKGVNFAVPTGSYLISD